MSDPTTRTVLVRIDASTVGWRKTHKQVTEEAVPWCAEHDSPMRGRRQDPCLFVQFILATQYEGHITACRPEPEPKHWKETG